MAISCIAWIPKSICLAAYFLNTSPADFLVFIPPFFIGQSETSNKAPILTYDKKKQPNFRYLRPYLESAHVKAGKQLSAKQLYALDVLDALLESSKFQFRYKMQKGDILFNLDSKVLHGRTAFSDDLNALPLNEIKGNDNILKRTMIRVWIKKNG